MDAREQRGLVIAATARGLRRKGQVWSVPSQTNSHAGKKYEVDLHAGTCTCLDHTEGGHKCKHLFAVQYTIQREYSDDGMVMTETESLTVQTTRKTYRQDWHNYNLAQTNEKAKFQLLLCAVCVMAARSPSKSDAVAAVFPWMMPYSLPCSKSIAQSAVAGLCAICDMRDARDKFFVRRMPSYNTIFRILEADSTTLVLKALIAESANPLKVIETNFAIDSTGFSSCRFDKWFDKKWGELKTRRAWVKAHIVCGVKTNVVTSVDAQEEYSSDVANFRPLFADTASRFKVNEVSADMAYSSEANLQAVIDAGGSPLIPFKSNATGASKGGLWAKMFHYFSFNRDEFLSRYHQRSNVESTFSMIKAKFGDSVRSKTDTAMRNEVLAKVLAHNICCLVSAMYELKIDPSFWSNTSATIAACSVSHN